MGVLQQEKINLNRIKTPLKTFKDANEANENQQFISITSRKPNEEIRRG
jgi:hypothetical protein